ncbi:MAG: hypothetical protein ACK5D5_00465 [Bacteroidota bacterium]
MKKIITLLFAFSIMFSYAQNNKQRAEKLINSLEKNLGLNKEQKGKVFEVVIEKMNSIEKAIKDNGGDKNSQPVMIEKRKFFSDMSSVLTQEQFQNWQRIRSEHLNLYREGKDVADLIFDPEMETVIRN